MFHHKTRICCSKIASEKVKSRTMSPQLTKKKKVCVVVYIMHRPPEWLCSDIYSILVGEEVTSLPLQNNTPFCSFACINACLRIKCLQECDSCLMRKGVSFWFVTESLCFISSLAMKTIIQS